MTRLLTVAWRPRFSRRGSGGLARRRALQRQHNRALLPDRPVRGLDDLDRAQPVPCGQQRLLTPCDPVDEALQLRPDALVVVGVTEVDPLAPAGEGRVLNHARMR